MVGSRKGRQFVRRFFGLFERSSLLQRSAAARADADDGLSAGTALPEAPTSTLPPEAEALADSVNPVMTPADPGATAHADPGEAELGRPEYRDPLGFVDEPSKPSAPVEPPASIAVDILTTPKATSNFSFEASAIWKDELRRSAATEHLASERPLVSIIMPTKNRLHRIGLAIESVLAQTYDGWELMIIDDGSNDGTFEVISERFSDARIRVIRGDGRGVCAARNAGLHETRGDVIAYLDDDNRWQPDYLEITLLQMLRSGASCCYSALRRLPNIFDESGFSDILCVDFDINSLKFKNYIDLNVFSHRRPLFTELGGFDESLRRMVDWDLIIRYCEFYPPTYCNSIGADYDNSDT